MGVPTLFRRKTTTDADATATDDIGTVDAGMTDAGVTGTGAGAKGGARNGAEDASAPRDRAAAKSAKTSATRSGAAKSSADKASAAKSGTDKASADKASADRDDADEAAAEARSKARTESKRERGQVTPKRAPVGRRAAPAPANRREASAQTRDARRRQRTEQREAMMNGEEWALMPRDKGPERRIARDVVDSRRTFSSYFFYVMIAIMVLSVAGGRSPGVALIADGLFAVMVLACAVDSFFLVRRVKRAVAAKSPASSTRGLAFYSIMRTLSFRRMRVPRPRVEIGAKI